jgi:hypothetical protein
MSDAIFWAEYSARDNWVVCGDIRLDLPKHHCFVRPLCQKLVEAGHPDGELRFRDPSMPHPYNFSIASIHRMAAGPVRQTRDEHIQNLKAKAAERAERRASAPKPEPVKLPKVRHYEPAAPDNKFVFVTIAGEKLRVNPMHRKAFEVITGTPAEWEAIHAKTRNYVVNVGWVKVQEGVPALTKLGEQVREAAEVAITTYRDGYPKGI